jgi:hypothetical protein
MIEGLRDTGYQFVTAVADIVDNSISAEATFIDISLEMDYRGNVELGIYDDGIGMDHDELVNAMKYGSSERPSPASLGKFGLGLKTASTAFCRKLIVISRNKASKDLVSATWDLDHIQHRKEWELLVNTPSKEQIEKFEKIIGKNNGTLVIWNKVDRLLKNYANQSGGHAKRALTKMEDDLHQHLSSVFQRFLDPKDSRARNIKIRLNGTQIEPWDPFCIGESELLKEDTPKIELSEKKQIKICMRAYMLPRKEAFSSEEAAKKADISNEKQGIYIYRENRLIHGPDWMRMFTKEPHLSLLRVEFSFDHMLDDVLHIDIKKSQILLDAALYEHIVDFLVPLRRAAEESYRKGSRGKTAAMAKTAHDDSNRNIGSKESDISQPTVVNVDPKKNEVEFKNAQGEFKIKLKISSAAKPSEVFIQPVESIDDGLLWEPCLIDGHWAVRINTSHPYYSKVYLPNLTAGVTIQGMDALLWGIAISEMNCTNEETKELFGDMRFEISRNLRKLVQDLPESKETE